MTEIGNQLSKKILSEWVIASSVIDLSTSFNANADTINKYVYATMA